MKSFERPTDELVAAALSELGSVAAQRHFFGKLENPCWLEPLVEKGWLDNPPQANRDDEGRIIGATDWPQSGWIARIAGFSCVSESVVRVIEKLSGTSNPWVQVDLATAILKLSADDAARLASLVAGWLKENSFRLPAVAIQLIEKLNASGKFKKAELVADALFYVDHSAKSSNWRAQDVVPAIDDYEFVEYLGRLLDSIGLETRLRWLKWLVRRLDKALRIQAAERASASKEDYSYIWYSSIEKCGDGSRQFPLDALVKAIRNLALTSINDECLGAQQVSEVLQRYPWPVLRRIELYVLAKGASVDNDSIKLALIQRDRIGDPSIAPEYDFLLEEKFSALAVTDRGQLLDWIEEEAAEKDQPEVWLHCRLAFLKPGLDKPRQELLQELNAKYGAIEQSRERDEEGWNERIVASPLSLEEARQLGAEGVALYLAKYDPGPEAQFGRTWELLDVLRRSVTSNPSDYAAVAPLLEAAPAQVISTYLHALAGSRSEWDWAPVLQLCQAVARHPSTVPVAEGDRPRIWDAQKAVLHIISLGLGKSLNPMPGELSEGVFDVLQALVNHPNRDWDAYLITGEREDNPLSESINTVNGEAMHCIVRFLLWRRAAVVNELDKGIVPPPAREYANEALGLLSLRLDEQDGASRVARAVFGRWLPWLYVLDRDWLASRVDRVMPSAEVESEARSVAWDVFIQSCEPYDDVYGVISEQYSAATRALAHESQEREGRQADLNLAEHIAVLYWRGVLGEIGDSRQLNQLADSASDSVLEHAISFVGKSALRTKREMPAGFESRLHELWGHWTRLVTQDDERANTILKEFGWWFAAGSIDREWALGSLIELIGLGIRAEPVHLVLGELAEVAPQFPEMAISALAGIVRLSTAVDFLGSQSTIRAVLEAVIHEEQLSQQARGLINDLLKLGHNFLDLIDS